MRGPSFSLNTPPGDDRPRRVCDHCGFIDYRNPRIVAGAVVEAEGQYLLCKRAIEPRRGYWTIPAGYLELGETPREGARREAREEANAEIDLGPLLATYSVLHVGQVHLIYRARLIGASFSAGPESLEVSLFDWDAIPWQDLAFPTIAAALRAARDERSAPDSQPDEQVFDATSEPEP